MAFSLLSLFGCGKAPEYQLIHGNEIVTEKDVYRQGDEVTVKAHIVLDEKAEMYVDGYRVLTTTEDYEWYVYTFEMPDHDVEVKCVYTNITVVPEKPDEIGLTMLVSAYSAVTGTEMEQPHRELTLYRRDDGTLMIRNFYGTSSDFDYWDLDVDEEAYESTMQIIHDAKMETWSKLDTEEPLDGGYDSCIFLEGDRYIKVDTESPMPEDGVRQIYTVLNHLLSYFSNN